MWRGSTNRETNYALGDVKLAQAKASKNCGLELPDPEAAIQILHNDIVPSSQHLILSLLASSTRLSEISEEGCRRADGARSLMIEEASWHRTRPAKIGGVLDHHPFTLLL